MKKAMAWVLSLALVLSMASAWAETENDVFKDLAGLEWSFSSGVGAWSTDLKIFPDGSFTGEFHDSEMGDSADAYPYGTVYFCSFKGQMRFVEQLDENACVIRVEKLEVDASEKEEIEDGIRFLAAEPYGVSEGDDMVLYRPGTPVSVLSEEMLLWAHVMDWENPPSELDTWFLSSKKNDSGFVGYEAVSMENPWKDMTAEELMEASGLSFGVPEGAENVIYRYLPSEGLAEMQFTIGNDEFCARIRSAALKAGELMNISGIYFYWDNEKPVRIGHCDGTVGQAQTGSEDWVELCLWYDLAPGLMYSLSVYTTDVDGLDLKAVAEQVYIPTQGDD